jgi:hypothetical protein
MSLPGKSFVTNSKTVVAETGMVKFGVASFTNKKDGTLRHIGDGSRPPFHPPVFRMMAMAVSCIIFETLDSICSVCCWSEGH